MFEVWFELIVRNAEGYVSFERNEMVPFQPRIGDKFIFGKDADDDEEAYLFPVTISKLTWNGNQQCFWATCFEDLDGDDNDNDCPCKVGDGCCRDLSDDTKDTWTTHGWKVFSEAPTLWKDLSTPATE